MGGITGTILTAVFAKAGGLATTGSAVLLRKRLGPLVFILAFTFAGSCLHRKSTNLLTPFG